MSKVVLKKDWDLPPHYSKNRGHFLGRENELTRLVGEIERRDGGTILLSGARGVGKTSLVYEALKVGRKDLDEKEIELIPVIINASQLEVFKGSSEPNDPRLHIIKNLIRRLYTALRSSKARKPLPDKVNELYEKAVAKEVEITKLYESAESEAIKNISIKNLEISITDFRLIIVSSLFAVSVVLEFAKPFPSEIANQIIPLLTIFPAPIAAFATWKIGREKLIERKESTTASSLYKQDGDLSNLEFDLEEVLEEIAGKDKKIVFVIDELDKIKKQEDVIDIVRAFKNLFTLSSAIYIFITGPELYKKIESELEDRGPEYTLFTTRAFISRPAFQDIENFVLDIVEPGGDPIPADYLNYLCFACKSDFFDLYNLVNDLADVKEGKQEIPLILDDRMIRLARLQKALGLVFDLYKRSRPSGWVENERLMTELYRFLSEFAEKSAGYQFHYETGSDFKGKAVESLAEFLGRLGALHIAESTLDETGTKTHAIQFTGTCVAVSSKIGTLLEYEKRYIDSYSVLEQEIRNIVGIDSVFGEGSVYMHEDDILERCNSLTGIDCKEIIQHNVSVQEGLLQSPPNHYMEEELSNRSAKIEELRTALIGNRRLVIENVLRQAFPDFVFQTIQSNEGLFSLTSHLRQTIINEGTPHIVATPQDLSKQVLISQDISPEAIQVERSNLRNARKVLNIINVTSGLLNYELGKNNNNWYKTFFRNIRNDDDIAVVNTELARIKEWLKS